MKYSLLNKLLTLTLNGKCFYYGGDLSEGTVTK